MSGPPPRFPGQALQKKNAAAVVLVVLGILGMIRHLISDSPKNGISSERQQNSRAAAGRSPSAKPLRAQAQDHGNSAPSEATLTMQRRLREFIIPDSGVTGLTVTEALAKLQEHWETLPHETDAVPPAEFVRSDAAASQLELPDNPPFVSLPIPGVSLLTNLRLLAAQVDLKVEVTKTGAILIPAETGTGTGNGGQPAGNQLSRDTLGCFKDVVDTGIGNTFTTPEGVEVTVTMVRNGAKEWGAVNPGAAGTPLFESDTSNADNKNDGSISSSSPREKAEAFGKTVDSPDSSAEAPINDPDGTETIEVTVGAEFAEFEGFINYGTPIQTTSINALGQSEPLVLTDSGITQPVFPTRTLYAPHRRALARMLGAMGLSDQTLAVPGMAEPFLDDPTARGLEIKWYFKTGLGYLSLGRADDAGDLFEKARAAAPTNPEFLKQLDLAQDRLEEYVQFLKNHPGDHSGPAWTSKVMSHAENILTSSTVPGPGYSWDQDTGILAATDDSNRTARILTEVAAAIQESVTLGALLEFSPATDWVEGRAPANPSAGSSTLPGAQRPGFSSNPKPAASPSPPVRLPVRSGTRSMAFTQVSMPASRGYSLLIRDAQNTSAKVTASGAGFQVRVSLDIPQAPDFASLQPAPDSPSLKTHAAEFMLPGPQWHRLDYPTPGSRTSRAQLSLFVRLTRTTIPVD